MIGKPMTKQKKNDPIRYKTLEDSIRHCYSTWGTRYYNDYYKSKNAYPPVHTQIINDLIKKYNCKSILDAGCGSASMLRDMDKNKIDRYGFDLTPEMVEEGKKIFKSQDDEPGKLWVGNVLNGKDYTTSQATYKMYDAGVCFGVLPHLLPGNEKRVIENFQNVIKKGGIIALEARNQLFSLFTLNRYTSDFFLTELINESKLREEKSLEEEDIDKILQQLNKHFDMDLPKKRKGYKDEPGYDEVLSRTHNPLELQETARECGLKNIQTLFYHFHSVPPSLEHLAPDTFRRLSLKAENPTNWKGYFMASAFILVGEVD